MDETLALFETAFFAFATDFQRDKQNNSAKYLETDTRQRVACGLEFLKSRRRAAFERVMKKLLSPEESAPHAWAVEKGAAQMPNATRHRNESTDVGLHSFTYGVNIRKQ